MKTKYILISVIVFGLLWNPPITTAADSEAYSYAKEAVNYITDTEELNSLIKYIKKQIKLLRKSDYTIVTLEEARIKGRDASIKSYISNARAQAELYYDNNERTYEGFCKSSFFVEMTDDLKGYKSVVTCVDNDTAYRMSGSLNDKSLYCADSTGNALVVKKIKKGILTCEY